MASAKFLRTCSGGRRDIRVQEAAITSNGPVRLLCFREIPLVSLLILRLRGKVIFAFKDSVREAIRKSATRRLDESLIIRGLIVVIGLGAGLRSGLIGRRRVVVTLDVGEVVVSLLLLLFILALVVAAEETGECLLEVPPY